MALLDVRIISGGTTYHLVNSSGTPTAGGAATGITTTPYSLAAKEWAPAVAPGQLIQSGGPPFRIGSMPLYRGYDNVTETVTIGIKASSSDNAVFLIQQLTQILNTALYSVPAVLYVLPPNNTNPVYFEIYAADVQPTTSGDWLNVVGGFVDVAVRVTWVRSPFGGAAALTTLLNAQVFTNINTSNTVSLGALTGDKIFEGQPLNIRMAPSAGNSIHILSTVKLHNHASNIAGNFTTSSTTFVAFTNGTNISASNIRDNRACRLRVLLRFKPTLTNPSKARLQVSLENGGGVHYVWPERALGTDTSGQLLDVGSVDMAMLRNSVISGSTGVAIQIKARSVDGTSITINLDYSEILLYYDYCTIITPVGSFPSFTAGAQNINGSAWLPQNQPQVYGVDGGDNFLQLCQKRGTIPRAFSGASLYMAMLTQTTLAHNTAHTATITAKHAPLYHLLRGNG